MQKRSHEWVSPTVPSKGESLFLAQLVHHDGADLSTWSQPDG